MTPFQKLSCAVSLPLISSPRCTLIARHAGNQWKGALYVSRDIALSILLLSIASHIKPWAANDFGGHIHAPLMKQLISAALWLAYWWFQGLTWAGIFCLGELYRM